MMWPMGKIMLVGCHKNAEATGCAKVSESRFYKKSLTINKQQKFHRLLQHLS